MALLEFDSMTTHIMQDIETLGTRPGSVVMSCALVRFSDEAHVTVNLSIPEQQALGLEVDPATSAWWTKQAAEHPIAWQRATENPLPLVAGLQYIGQWLEWAGRDRLIWAHGATFDPVLLTEVYRRAGVKCPWDYWAVRDTRTLYDLAGVNPKDFAIPPPHVAVNDAIGQTRAANEALRILARAHAA